MGLRKGNSRRAQDPASRIQSGLHTVNILLTVLLLRAPMCRASVGWRSRKDKAVWSSCSKTQLMQYYTMFNHPVRDVTSCVGAWSNYYF